LLTAVAVGKSSKVFIRSAVAVAAIFPKKSAAAQPLGLQLYSQSSSTRYSQEKIFHLSNLRSSI
jgi:hypothetical protein